MRAIGEGLSYLVKDGEAYLLGKLNHDSFVEIPATIKDKNFSFTIDTSDKYLDFDKLKDIEDFERFKFPIREVYDISKEKYKVTTLISNDKEVLGKMIVQKVVYDGMIPAGYVFFEFELHESKRKKGHILVNRSHSNGHIMNPF